ncbi:uncharacterized protein PRCAT00002932001 [Priceomyces carsonii]|uniref:uncharacterized protein n=1 Tax=Priceomyces carsonii TaxID=28549 RepID=UPI002ED93AF8|nr:unnamed protein product [Priceomyces carsonii]
MIQMEQTPIDILQKEHKFMVIEKLEEDPGNGHKLESNNAHNSPSTPGSLKGSRSDSSEMASDTSPSSVEDERSVHSNHTLTKNNIIDIDPLHVPESSNSTIKTTLHGKLVLGRIPSGKTTVGSSVINETANEEPKTAVGGGLAATLVSPESAFGRRHTSPHPTPALSTAVGAREPISPKRSLDVSLPTAKRPIARSTFPSYNSKLGTGPIPRKQDVSRGELIRMGSSLVGKKTTKKIKKNSIDEEKVLVGNKISEGHENYVMAYNMLTGIRVAVSRCSGVMKKIDDEDFKVTKKLSFNFDGSDLTPSSKYDFKFKDYAPEVFRELRSRFGLDPADYLVSITGKYILSELGSPGKSGSFFYFSRDYRFIIKTIHHSEHKQLRKILKVYYNHVKENPNTLICQFYGLHRLKMPFTTEGTRKVHFIVMNNLFPPHRDVHVKYDLKGSLWGRTTPIAPGQDISGLTLKDNNFLARKEKIQFGPSKRDLFFKQLDKDVSFLKRVNVMDYSLLLGIHDVKKGNTFDLSQKLSVFDPKSDSKSELIKTNPRDIDRFVDLPSDVYPGRMKYVFYGHDGGIRATTEDNDPCSEIYYMGIIDCLTNYSLKKKLETLWRSIGHSRSAISSVPADEYGDRFLRFIKDGTTKGKKKVQ